MNQIAELLPVGNVALDVDAATKSRLFDVVAQLFERDIRLPPREIVASLAAREKLGSTGLGQGIAIALAQAGADIVAINRSDARDTEREVVATGRKFHSIYADLERSHEASRVIAQAVEAGGRVHSDALGRAAQVGEDEPHQRPLTIRQQDAALAVLDGHLGPDVSSKPAASPSSALGEGLG